MVLVSPAIDYRKIAKALDHYSAGGYSFIDVPWFVSRQAMQVTAPPNLRFCTSFLGDLVASGEQSFIQLWMDGKIGKGKWHCVTPCFRDEPNLNEFRLNYFMKVELIEVDPNDVSKSIKDHIEYALDFFELHSCIKTCVIDTEIGKDIISADGIELGSYGEREHEGFRWTYGTGVAEPRLSYAELMCNS